MVPNAITQCLLDVSCVHFIGTFSVCDILYKHSQWNIGDNWVELDVKTYTSVSGF